MLAEFEKMIYESIEAGKHLSIDDLCKMYGQLNAKYFGPDMVIDDEVSIKWATIPHLYFDFYVYQYVIGFAAASYLSKVIIEEGESAVERYKDLLKSVLLIIILLVLRRLG